MRRYNEYAQENPRINRQDRLKITFPGSANPQEISQQCTPATYTEAVHCQRVLLGVCLWPLKAPGSTFGGGLPNLSSARWCQYPHTLKNPCWETGQTEPDLVAFYDIQTGNREVYPFNPVAHTGLSIAISSDWLIYKLKECLEHPREYTGPDYLQGNADSVQSRHINNCLPHSSLNPLSHRAASENLF